MPYGFKDPSSLLRPWPNKDLQFFAEELYALLVSSESIDIGGQPQDKRVLERLGVPKPAPEPPLQPFKSTIESRTEAVRSQTYQPEPSPTITQPSKSSVAPSAPRVMPQEDISRVPSTPSKSNIHDAIPRLPLTPEEEEVRRKNTPRDSQASTLKIPGNYGEELEQKKSGLGPIVPPLDIGNFASPIGSGSGTIVYIGKVVSGTGDTYEMKLFNPDTTQPDQIVEVKILQIDHGETIPPNTFVPGVFPYTDRDGNTTFYAQVPLWIE